MPIHTEFFSSKGEAITAGKRLAAKHGFTFEVSYAMRADMSHDWMLKVFS